MITMQLYWQVLSIRLMMDSWHEGKQGDAWMARKGLRGGAPPGRGGIDTERHHHST